MAVTYKNRIILNLTVIKLQHLIRFTFIRHQFFNLALYILLPLLSLSGVTGQFQQQYSCLF